MSVFKIFFWFVIVLMVLLAKGTLTLIKLTGHRWLKLVMPYYHSANYNGANWQDDNSNQRTSQENSNLQDCDNNQVKTLRSYNKCQLQSSDWFCLRHLNNPVVMSAFLQELFNTHDTILRSIKTMSQSLQIW